MSYFAKDYGLFTYNCDNTLLESGHYKISKHVIYVLKIFTYNWKYKHNKYEIRDFMM